MLLKNSVKPQLTYLNQSVSYLKKSKNLNLDSRIKDCVAIKPCIKRCIADCS
uniref:Uncharacterized protein n=1 Tax=Rhizophagus irregularis (strain DAOM 181602 / DAOM 197198 / MUCL 43194) TaxID=747089 RepID=U9UG29_RHIID